MPESPQSPLTFEQALADLEEVVRQLEDGQIGLEQALERYEKGVGLLKHCYGLLQKVEQRILVLTGVDGAGQPVTKPFEQAEEEPKERSDNARRPRKSGGTEQASERSFFG